MDGSVFTRERPVFVAADSRRARRLRYGGAAVGILACLWVAALAVGMLGTGRLPGLSLPSGVRGAELGVRETAPAKVERSLARVPATPRRSREPRVSRKTVAVREKPRVRKSPAQPTRRQTVNRPRYVRDASPPLQPVATPTAPQAASPAAPAPAPPPPNQGWARQGYTAPPGQTRRAEAQPAPAPTTPQPAPAPPGQQKKAEDPNPKG